MTDTASAAPSDGCREAFFAWHINHVSRKPRLETASGTWEDDKKAWAAWQAAWNRRAQPTPPAVVEPLTEEQADRAARKMSDIMDYPWDYMLEQGRNQMREHARAIVAAAHCIKGAQDA